MLISRHRRHGGKSISISLWDGEFGADGSEAAYGAAPAKHAVVVVAVAAAA